MTKQLSLSEFLTQYEEYLAGRRDYSDLPLFPSARQSTPVASASSCPVNKEPWLCSFWNTGTPIPGPF